MLKRAILFDIDGTLVDSNDAHVDAWQQAFAGEGFRFTRGEIHKQIGKGGDNLVPSLLPDADDALCQRLSDAEHAIFTRGFLPGIAPFPGARDVLQAMAERGHTVILASSASAPEIEHYVDLLAAGGLISGTTGKDDVPSSKPCPDIFVAALERTGCTPENAMVIGDTPYDMIAARGAGIDAIAVLSGGFDEDELRASGAVAVYAHVADLAAQYDKSPLGQSSAADQDALEPSV